MYQMCCGIIYNNQGVKTAQIAPTVDGLNYGLVHSLIVYTNENSL